MTSINRLRSLALSLAGSAILAFTVAAGAQEVSEEHLKAARAAVAAINATDTFDTILPGAAAGLKESLIQKNPDMQEVITRTVDEKTIAMASRRADLEREAALAYAKVFTVEDLNAIAAFYESPAGQKLLTEGAVVLRELNQAAEIWQRGIARDLAAEVGKALEAELAQSQPAPQATGEAAQPATQN